MASRWIFLVAIFDIDNVVMDDCCRTGLQAIRIGRVETACAKLWDDLDNDDGDRPHRKHNVRNLYHSSIP